MPSWVSPMLATLTDRRFSDQNWIFERKLDGERCVAYRDGDTIELKSRNRKILNDHYPELAEALAMQSKQRFIVDGEIVAFDGRLTSFSQLQKRMHIEDPELSRRSGVKVYLYVFDRLYLGRSDVSEVSQRDRKTLLKRVFSYADPLRYTPHRNADGEAVFRQACEKGWEGIIAKHATSSYVHGRSRRWLKFKSVNRQAFVIGGYTDPRGSRRGFGALLLGFHRGDTLTYAGKVGTGFDDPTLDQLQERLEGLERTTPAFGDAQLPADGIHWVTPSLVAEVGFQEWTAAGKLRHPRFLGLRRDKRAADVVREEPCP
jgi:bifunctional non-homologous end joining protein LigD